MRSARRTPEMEGVHAPPSSPTSFAAAVGVDRFAVGASSSVSLGGVPPWKKTYVPSQSWISLALGVGARTGRCCRRLCPHGTASRALFGELSNLSHIGPTLPALIHEDRARPTGLGNRTRVGDVEPWSRSKASNLHLFGHCGRRRESWAEAFPPGPRHQPAGSCPLRLSGSHQALFSCGTQANRLCEAPCDRMSYAGAEPSSLGDLRDVQRVAAGRRPLRSGGLPGQLSPPTAARLQAGAR
jgi:hypothetical protein